MKKQFLSVALLLCIYSVIFIYHSFIFAANIDTIQILPLHNYKQNVANYIDESSNDFNIPLIQASILDAKTKDFKEHLMGSLSPWAEIFVTNTVKDSHPHEILQKNFLKFREHCDTPLAKSFAVNFKAYPCSWFDNTVSKNINFPQFVQQEYNSKRRAIAVNNTSARLFPTYEPLFYNHKIAGNGYPFDQLQDSSIWIGSPLYVIGNSLNGWSLVLTHTKLMTWIPTSDIAFVTEKFIKNYMSQVNTNGLRVIVQTEVNINSEYEKNQTLTVGYIGSIFPGKNKSENIILLPIKLKEGNAKLIAATVNINGVSSFPLTSTPANFLRVIKELNGRSYGWGGLYFNNDCSQELQSIFTVFGIWLPRNSVDQYKIGKIIDLSNLKTEQRIQELSRIGRKLVTLVYIPGHIMLYVGNIQGSPWVYNNIWALRPEDNSYRSIIGQAAFLPLLNSYMIDDSKLISLADEHKRTKFILYFLDEMN